jgi:SM-20-related protein
MSPEVCARVAAALAREAVCIEPGFLAAELVHALAHEARAAEHAGRLRPATIGRAGTRALRPEVRGDHILWLDEPVSDAQRAFLAHMEALRLALNAQLCLGLFDFECHFALYPPASFYQRHVDRFRSDSRRTVSCVVYLNETWQADWGGALRLYASAAADAAYRDVLPLGGTLVCFLSEQVSHEVLPTTHARLSLTGWFRRRA